MIFTGKNNKNMIMKNIIIILVLSFTLASCAAVKEKIPTLKDCDGTETNKTLAEILCKKK